VGGWVGWWVGVCVCVCVCVVCAHAHDRGTSDEGQTNTPACAITGKKARGQSLRGLGERRKRGTENKWKGSDGQERYGEEEACARNEYLEKVEDSYELAQAISIAVELRHGWPLVHQQRPPAAHCPICVLAILCVYIYIIY
jgi:hypothetical protein